MRSITTLDLQYAHRFYGFKGEAQYLHGHSGILTIEVEDSVEPGVNMVFPCNEIQKTAWDLPRGTTGSLSPTFVPARLVGLAVRLPSANTARLHSGKAEATPSATEYFKKSRRCIVISLFLSRRNKIKR